MSFSPARTDLALKLLRSSSWKAIWNIFCTVDLTWSCCGQARASNNKHPLYFWIINKMVVFVVVTHACSVVTLGTVSLALPSSLVCGLSSNCSAWRMVYMSRWLHFFCLACKFIFFDDLFLIPCSSREIWGMNLPNLPEVSCVECLPLASVMLALQWLMLLWQ